MKKIRHVVEKVNPGSIAEELEIESGDEVLQINGSDIEDIFDYRYLIQDEYLELLLRKPSGEEWLLEIEKDYDEDLGIDFENSLMDEYRSCRNNCIFCFIDQMPPNMRETLYFKDDDARLSFLQGNYVTLTNMSDHDIDRIIRYHLSPINISFHTTNPELRCKMLKNRFAGKIFDKVRRLCDAGLELNGQIVLCKGWNDGAELERTLSDLSEYAPELQSVSVVPVGLTKFRENLEQLEPFNQEDAKAVLDTVHKWQNIMMERFGYHFIHASDEWYLLAGLPLPGEETYDGYPQYENGVGMLRLLDEELTDLLNSSKGDDRERKVTVATGRLAAPFLKEQAEKIQKKYPGIKISVVPIINHFFGEEITVSGLITGQDLVEQLKELDLGDNLLVPCNMLRSGENVFLDDYTIEKAEQELSTRIRVVDQPGEAFLQAVIEPHLQEIHRRRQIYEQADCSNCGPA